MTTHPHHPHEPPNDAHVSEQLPADLVPTARALDRLAAYDGAAMPPELCERIATSTSARLMAREVSSLDALSTSDRAAAPSTLEDRVFMATRGVINQAGARLHEPVARTPGRRHIVGRIAGRLAIAAALLLTAGVTVRILENQSTPTTDPAAAPQVASAIQSDLDELAALLDTGEVREDVAGLNVALRTVEDAMDDDPLKPGIDDGGAL